MAHHDLQNFEVFEGEPLVLKRLRQRGSNGRILLLIPFTGLCLLILLAGISGRLVEAHTGSDITSDLSRLFNLRKTAAYKRIPSNGFPLLRDWYSICVVAILLTTPFWVYRQWLGIEIFLSALDKRRLIESISRDRLSHEVQRTNEHIRRVGAGAALVCLVSAASVTLVLSGNEILGVYGRFIPKDIAVEWWASRSSSVFTSLAYFVCGTIGIYYILLQNLVGGRVVLFLWSTRRFTRFKADPEVLDDWSGYGSARQALLYTYVTLAAHGTALLLVGIQFPRTTSVRFLLPLLGQWFIVLPIYLLLPITLLRRHISEWKKTEKEILQKQIDRARNAGDESTVNVLIEKSKRITAVKSVPIGQLRDLPAIVFGVLAGVASVVALYIVYA